MAKKCFGCGENARNFYLLVLRLTVGAIFIYAGYGKLADIAATTGFFDGFGYPAPAFFAYLVGIVELVGGVAVVIGFLTRFFAGVLAIVMVVAILTVHISGPFVQMQLPLALLGASLGLAASGAGAWRVYEKECACEIK